MNVSEHFVLRGGEIFTEGRPQSTHLPTASATTSSQPGIGQVTIDVLPDGALLEIFHFFEGDLVNRISIFTWRWIELAHVCRRWRNVIFGLPQRLDVRLVCKNATPARTSPTLGIWPPFPIAVSCERMHWPGGGSSNVIAAFKHSDRISDVEIFNIDGSALENLVDMMQGPFPILRFFYLKSSDGSIPVVPETFLGGSKPRLETFMLSGVPFLSFPKFVSSALSIEFLSLRDIPNSGYISPETMATCLAALPNLSYLSIGFRSPLSRPIQIGPPPLTRSVLPALARLVFHGVSEYLEEFVARIDAPLLYQLHVMLFMDPIFHIPRLHDFIQRIEGLMPCNQAFMEFTGPAINIIFGSRAQFKMEVRCQGPDWQLSSVAQISASYCPSSLTSSNSRSARDFGRSIQGGKTTQT